MNLASRLFLSWDEAAQLLGYDREGLRQMMLQELNDPASDSWLPVGFDTHGRDYVAVLIWDHGSYSVATHSECPESTGRIQSLTFVDGTVFPSIGRSGDKEATWEATHDHRSGYRECYFISGRFLIDPTIVEYACQDAGDLRPQSLHVSPREWMHGGEWSGFRFRLLSKQLNTTATPENLFTDAVFYASDVSRIVEMKTSKPATPAVSTDSRNLGARERNNLYRIIRALSVMAKLPKTGYAESVIRQMGLEGLDAPSDDTIRRVIEATRNLKS